MLLAVALNDQQLRDIQFDQKTGAQTTLSLPFVDETGKTVTLGAELGGKPTILALGYYRCPMLCTLELNGLVASLQDLKPGSAPASVVFVSVDPTETPALAAAKKATYMKLYARRGAAADWHFLTGPKSSVDKLAEETGFRFAYDPASQQYAHPSGLIILTPEGKVSTYFFGINFVSRDLDAALRAAARHETKSPVQQFVYLCFHYNPIRGKYGAAIMDGVRIGGVATLAGLAGVIWQAQRRKETR
jgi:protein SCO1/2